MEASDAVDGNGDISDQPDTGHLGETGKVAAHHSLRTPQARIRFFVNYTIDHELLARARQGVLHHVFSSHSGDTWTPVILLMGPPGVGKSTLLHALERDITRRLRTSLMRDPGRIPYVSSAMEVADRSARTWKYYCAAILDAVEISPNDKSSKSTSTSPSFPQPGDLRAHTIFSRQNASESTLRRDLIAMAQYRRPAAFLIDEAQQMTGGASARALLTNMDYIKRMADATHVPHVLIGNYGLCAARSVSGQLGRRTLDVHFRRYDARRQEDVVAFRNILHTLQFALPLPSPPPLAEWWEYLYTRSVGCIGILKPWLTSALEYTLNQPGRKEAIFTEEILRRSAPAPSKTKRILSEALEGESELEELEDVGATYAAERELRMMLGFATTPSAREEVSLVSNASSDRPTPPSSAENPAIQRKISAKNAEGKDIAGPSRNGKKREWRPGERSPARDPVASPAMRGR